ncbi:MAG: hypothetical protein KF767_06875 [Bdellovibrionaceae bacterium]|jgi:hypothetical protein|nr:hypothetical protein [Pseudobdellovibrionaceae bacterium]
MKSSLKTLSALSLISIMALASGCAKGDKGDPGDPGSGRIVSTINCGGNVAGTSTTLDGIRVEYNAVLTSGGDVYVTGNIIDELSQVSGTEFYAAGQNGAATGKVLVTFDQRSPANGGTWELTLNRVTLETLAVYKDSGYADVVIPFAASACTVMNW